MRSCGVCRRAPRVDESLRHLQTHADTMGANAQQFLFATWGAVPTDTIGASACESCYAKLTGTDLPATRTYPHGKPVPTRPDSDGDIDVCGVCRRAMYEDDEPRHIRLHREDLIDELWAEYSSIMAEANSRLADIRAGAEDAYGEATADFQYDRDREFRKASDNLRRQLEDIVLSDQHGGNLAVIAMLEAKATADHQQRVNQADAECRAAAGPAKAVMESALAVAGLTYRRAAIQAWRKLEPFYPGYPPEIGPDAACRECVENSCQPSIEPGGYNTCRECMAIYQPRIVERLKRQGLVAAHLDSAQVQGDMLM